MLCGREAVSGWHTPTQRLGGDDYSGGQSKRKGLVSHVCVIILPFIITGFFLISVHLLSWHQNPLCPTQVSPCVSSVPTTCRLFPRCGGMILGQGFCCPAPAWEEISEPLTKQPHGRSPCSSCHLHTPIICLHPHIPSVTIYSLFHAHRWKTSIHDMWEGAVSQTTCNSIQWKLSSAVSKCGLWYIHRWE